MKKIIGAIALVVLAVGGYFIYKELQRTESTDDAEIDGNVVAISPRVPGHVIEVRVEDQQFVNKGDVLVRLDPKDYEVALAKARADLADALASLQSSRTDIPLTSTTTGSALTAARSVRADAAAGVSYAEKQLAAERARLASAEANVKVAEANALKAGQDVERYKSLVAKDEISRQLYDQAAAAYDAARATVEAQRAQVAQAQQNVAAAQAGVEQAKAKLAQAEAQVEAAMTGPQQVAITQSRAGAAQAKVEQMKAGVQQAELNLSYTTITAPVSGIVGKKNVNIGQNVAAGQQMMAIVDINDLWVTANFKETQLKEIKPGLPVDIHVDANGREYKGKVERIGGASGAKFSLLPPENATGNFVKVVQRIPVRIEFEPGQDTGHVLRPGMSVEPSVHVR
jgi:membrane fusion protein (multidrug efflux system)